MIPYDLQESIFPQIADGDDDAAVLHHACGVDFKFQVNTFTGDPYFVTRAHLRSWRVSLEKVAEVAGSNCFSYNTLTPEPSGVYHDIDRNVYAILFAPGTFLEHNDVEGRPLLLVVSESECILTGSSSDAGSELIRQYLPKSIATSVVTIDSKWRTWVAE